MVVPSDGVGVLGGQLSDEISGALSRLYVRILRSDKNGALYDTVRVHELNSGIVAWTPTRLARESCTECAKIVNEPFVTV